MASDKNWVDYVNVGSNIFRNFQLSNVEDRLGAMASIAAVEQAKSQNEDKLREMVFQADTNLRHMRDHVNNEKMGVLALATFMLGNFKRFGLTSEKFRSFEDKERLRSVLEGFKALADECSSDLSIAERSEAQQCAQYMSDPTVKASAPTELVRQLGKAKQELSRLLEMECRVSMSWRKSLLHLPRPFGGMVLGAVLLYFCSLILNSVARDGIGDTGVFVMITILLTVCGGILVVFFGRQLLHILRDLDNRKPQVRKSREDAAEATRLRPAKEAEVEALQQKVNGEIERERARLENERDALMAKVLKHHSARS